MTWGSNACNCDPMRCNCGDCKKRRKEFVHPVTGDTHIMDTDTGRIIGPKESTTRLSPCRCPYCDTLLDAATPAVGKAIPKPGDLSVCIKCASPLVFDGQLRLRKPYFGEVASHPQLDVVMRAVRALDRR